MRFGLGVHTWRLAFLSVIAHAQLAHGCAKDGAYEDHAGESRPVQYHAFTLALEIVMESLRPRRRRRGRIRHGITFLRNFIGPDGDFNYFGRGQRQIFGYGPALFALESAVPVSKSASADAKSLWSLLKGYQHTDGSFPLTLNRYLDELRVGWYDYHRLSVYNAFLGAWLAMAELQRETGRWSVDTHDAPTRARIRKDRPEIAFVRTPLYFAVASKGYPMYTSECAVSPHRLWFEGIGVVLSCPGGPSCKGGGFGKIVVFKDEYVNFFSPIYRGRDGEWHSPARKDVIMKGSGRSYSWNVACGVMQLYRTIDFLEEEIRITDEIVISRREEVSELRIINIPLNVEKKNMDVTNTSIALSVDDKPRVLRIDVDSSVPLQRLEEFPWVEGDVLVIGALAKDIDREYTVGYRFYLEPKNTLRECVA